MHLPIYTKQHGLYKVKSPCHFMTLLCSHFYQSIYFKVYFTDLNDYGGGGGGMLGCWDAGMLGCWDAGNALDDTMSLQSRCL